MADEPTIESIISLRRRYASWLALVIQRAEAWMVENPKSVPTPYQMRTIKIAVQQLRFIETTDPEKWRRSGRRPHIPSGLKWLTKGLKRERRMDGGADE